MILIPESQEMALGLTSYREILSKERLSHDPELVGMVNRVGRRIAAVAGRPDFQWEFNVLVDDRRVNAFALPGGKVGVYTGILPYIRGEAGLAVVLAHEIGHAIARHGAERMSVALLAELGQAGMNMAVRNQSPEVIRSLNVAYGVGAAVGVLLPFSRKEESEADRIGLVLMAKAGYDPREAVPFWLRMARFSQRSGKVPEFLSTHPADKRRIRQIRSWMPEALRYYWASRW